MKKYILYILVILLLISIVSALVHDFFKDSKDKSNKIIHKEAIKKYNSNNNTKSQDSIDSYFKFLKSYKEGNEDGLLYLLRIYLYGIHPEYSPDKTTGLKLINRILNDSNHFSHELKLVCKMLYDDTITMYNNDVDSLHDNYKDLPSNIVTIIDEIIDYQISNNIKIIKCTMQTSHQTQIHRIPQQNNDVDDNNNDIIIDFMVYDDNNDNQENIDLTILNDSQNVHNHTIQNISKNILNDMKKNDNSFNKNITDFKILIQSKELAESNVTNIEMVLDSFTDNIHSKYNMSEKDVFSMCYERINNKDNIEHRNNLFDIFIQNIESGVEHGIVVCSTGKITRMLSSFDIVDEELPDLKPDWIIKQELLTKASNVREIVFNECSKEEKVIYDNYDDNYPNDKKVVHDRIKSQIETTFKKQCIDDYVNTNILSESALDVYIYDIIIHF